VVLGLVCPFAVYRIGQAAFRGKADGSFITGRGISSDPC
jgi:K+-transporting ATPase c subunit